MGPGRDILAPGLQLEETSRMADRSKSSAPNIIFILADDLGYAKQAEFDVNGRVVW